MEQLHKAFSGILRLLRLVLYDLLLLMLAFTIGNSSLRCAYHSFHPSTSSLDFSWNVYFHT